RQERSASRRYGRRRTRLFNPKNGVAATLNGMPLRLIAVTNRQPLLGLLVRKGINSVSELRGKKLSISSFGGAIYGAAVYLSRTTASSPRKTLRSGREDLTLRGPRH